MPQHWIQTDEVEDVAGSIRHIIRVSQFLGQDPQTWKWVAVALHSALQGACICHLTTTAVPLGAVTPQNAEKSLAYFEDSRSNPNAKRPRTHLMGLPDLLKAVRKPCSAGDRSNSVGIAISDCEFNSLRRFHENIRNQFVHFEPMGWSIDVSGIPAIARLVARIIGEMLHIGYAFRHQEDVRRAEMQQSLQALVLIEWPI
ncbi:hypothetical protein [Sphingobium sp.]|uniref:hypothetical protein n=1 Tax=Sphingobium sp. TaxID=1912891 RepID=UPI0025CF9FAE|nr:hypothetical protein [Sphingobium sp.]